LYNEKRGDLGFMSGSGAAMERLAEIPVPLDGSLAGVVFRTGDPLIINDVANDPRHYRIVSERTNFQPQSLLGVPMRRRDRTSGVLEALNKRSGGLGDAEPWGLVVT